MRNICKEISDVGTTKTEYGRLELLMKTGQPEWKLSNRRCHCACGGEGFLNFIACPSCHNTVLVCSEVGTVFPDPWDPTEPSLLSWLDFSTDMCPQCGKISLSKYEYATWEDVQALGFKPGEYE